MKVSGEPDEQSARIRLDLRMHQLELKLQNEELRRTQIELEEANERYFDLYQMAPVGYCTIDEQGCILEANLRAGELLGLPVEELEHERLVRFIRSEDHEVFLLQRRRAFATLGTEALELRMLSSSGAELTVWMVLAAAVQYGRGTMVARVTMSDISLRKRMEKERQQLQTQLAQVQKLEAIGTLAGGIAHDFNNLLAGVTADLALLELEQTDRAAWLEHVNDIKLLTDRAADLTKQLLGFARRGKFEIVPLDFDHMLDKVCNVFQRMHKGLTLRVIHSSGTRQVLADRGQIEQVLMNLFINAGQAMAGSGELRVVLEETTLSACDVEAHGVQPGEYFRLSVSDQGVGMSEEVRQRVFDPFFTTHEPGAGSSGLGLASVYGIVKNHNGFITVESTVGEGSTFIVHLPSTERVPAPVPIALEDIPRNGEGTLLLVDDEEQIARSWGRTLRHLGYDVLSVASGVDAIELVRREPSRFSLVILDLIMPGMSGSATFDELHRIAPGLKVLIWSGYGSDGVATDLIRRGCCGFVQKPASVAALSSKLRELL